MWSGTFSGAGSWSRSVMSSFFRGVGAAAGSPDAGGAWPVGPPGAGAEQGGAGGHEQGADDDGVEDEATGDGEAGLVSAAEARVGAQPKLEPGSKDAALLLYLKPGVYTLQVSGVNATTGVALVEAYEVGD